MNETDIPPSDAAGQAPQRHLKRKDLDRVCGSGPDPHLPLACNEDECFVTHSELDAHDDAPEPVREGR